MITATIIAIGIIVYFKFIKKINKRIIILPTPFPTPTVTPTPSNRILIHKNYYGYDGVSEHGAYINGDPLFKDLGSIWLEAGIWYNAPIGGDKLPSGFYLIYVGESWHPNEGTDPSKYYEISY